MRPPVSMRSLRCLWLAGAVLALAPTAAPAQPPTEREVKAPSGQDVQVGVYTDIRPDCTTGPLPAIRVVAPPAHGALNVKRGSLKLTNYKQCLATEVPVFVAYYRAKADFSGDDAFVLEVTFVSGRKEVQRFHVSVSGAPGKNQGI